MSQNCVLKGTLITLEDDVAKEIENLKVGEKLLSYSIEGLQNTQKENLLGKTRVGKFEGEFSYQLIKNIWKNTFDKYYKINDQLNITGDHYIFCKRDNEYYWIQVENLQIGDSLFKSDNLFEEIKTIQIIEDENTVYNIQVNSIYTYFAEGYLIHNGGPEPCSKTNCYDCWAL